MHDHIERDVKAYLEAPLRSRERELQIALERATARIDGIKLREAVTDVVAARRPRVRNVALVAAVLAFATTGLAFAADDIGRFFFGDKSPAREIDQLATEEGTQVTADEYDALRSATNVVPATSGQNGGLQPKWELAPIERARVIVDDATVGRVIAVPTSDGETICLGYMPPSESGNMYGCDAQLDRAGLLSSVARSSRPGASEGDEVIWEVYGLAADDVSTVQVKLADGSSEQAALRENGFYWTGTGVEPVGLESTRGGDTEAAAFRRYPKG